MRGRGLLFLRSQERRHRDRVGRWRDLCLEETEDRVGVGRPRGHRRAASRGQDLTGGWGLSWGLEQNRPATWTWHFGSVCSNPRSAPENMKTSQGDFGPGSLGKAVRSPRSTPHGERKRKSHSEPNTCQRRAAAEKAGHPGPASYANREGHRPAPAPEPDGLNATGCERRPAPHLQRPIWGWTLVSGPIGRRHSAEAVRRPLGRPQAVAAPADAKWYGPQGRGPGHVTRPRPPFCSAVLVFRAQRQTGRVAFAAA